jgi:hypothetical protein
VRAGAVVLVALILTGCETTAEKSAKLERQALRAAAHAQHATGLTITHPSSTIRVLDSTVLHSSEGAAVAVTLANSSPRAVADVPIAVTVRGAGGTTAYPNSSPGLVHSLVSAPLIAPHGQLTWIDDQVTSTPASPSATAEVGEGTTVEGPVPAIAVVGAHIFEEPGSGFGAKGAVVNHSTVAQAELVVYATARRGARILAAGRAVLSQVPAGASVPFQLYFIGDPRGAQLQVSAPPSTVP